MSLGAVLSTLNSTATPLGSATSYLGTFEEAIHFAAISVAIKSDVASVADGVKFVWSVDQVSGYFSKPIYTYRLTDDYGNPITGQVFTSEIYGRFFQISFEKDISIQTVFTVQTILHYAPVQFPAERIVDRLNRQALALPVKLIPSGALPLSKSGTIAAPNVSQAVMAANPARKWACFQNVSDTEMWINYRGVAAVAAQPSYRLYPGGYWESGPIAPTEGINVLCSASGKGYSADEV